MNYARNFLDKYPVMIILVVVLTLAAYSFMLAGDFKTVDDQSTIVDNKDLQSFGNIGKIFSTSFFGRNSYYRPLVGLSNMINYQWGGGGPFVFNLTDLLLHILTALCVFLLVQIMLDDRRVSFFSSLLFAIHPIQWSAVCLIAGRAIILCTLFYVLAFLLFCLFDKKRRWIYYLFSLMAFVLSLLSKETAVTLPAVLFFYVVFLKQKETKARAAHLGYVLPFALIEGAYFILRKFLGITNVGLWASVKDMALGISTFIRAVFMYFRLLVFPVDLHFDRASRYFVSFTEPQLILAVAGLLIIGGVLFKTRRHLPGEAKFFIFWFLLTIIPVSQIFPVAVNPGYASTAEHFLYMPSVGMFILLVLSARWIFRKAKKSNLVSPLAAKLIVIGIYSFFALLTAQYSIYSSSEIAMFKHSLRFNPANARVHTSLALAFTKKNLLENARDEFMTALRYDPYDLRARIGLGKVLFDMGHYFEGIDEYEKAANAGGMSPLLKNNIELSYSFLIKKYRAKIDTAPDDPRAHFSLGVIYSRSGRTAEAVTEYQKAVELDPNAKDALFNLAVSYAALNEYVSAIRYYEQMLGLKAKPDYLDYHACVNLARIYDKLGNGDKSREYRSLAEQMPPEFREFKESYIAKLKEE